MILIILGLLYKLYNYNNVTFLLIFSKEIYCERPLDMLPTWHHVRSMLHFFLIINLVIAHIYLIHIFLTRVIIMDKNCMNNDQVYSNSLKKL